MMTITLGLAYDDLCDGVAALDRGWLSEHERPGMQHAAGEVLALVRVALRRLGAVEMTAFDRGLRQMQRKARLRASRKAAHQELERLDEAAREVVREAYAAVLAFGFALRRAASSEQVSRLAAAACHESLTGMLDALSPYVGRVDDHLRHVILDDEPMADVAKRLGHAG